MRWKILLLKLMKFMLKKKIHLKNTANEYKKLMKIFKLLFTNNNLHKKELMKLYWKLKKQTIQLQNFVKIVQKLKVVLKIC